MEAKVQDGLEIETDEKSVGVEKGWRERGKRQIWGGWDGWMIGWRLGSQREGVGVVAKELAGRREGGRKRVNEKVR